ncbi:MAG: GTPase ObgE [Deltaproteobacteria bacterium]|nr:GTPase ObgE [Deltaproteobacteria bacterium]
MAFIDEAVISIRSGDGGRGCVSFRREKYIPRGGPDGGNGGNGGNIIIRASTRLHTLDHFRAKRHFKAQHGSPGRGKSQTGKDGNDVIIGVPLGTMIYDHDSGELLADLIEKDQEILLLQGGRGGKGNEHFKTSTNRAPRMAQPGLPGQKKLLKLSLKYLADIGLIGFPNAGKSTLLSCLTTARPRIDSYPFTTLMPNLGVISLEDDRVLTIADIPGLIDGASEGRGLGLRFLKHIERTKLLLHLLDITYVPKDDILEDFFALRNELEKFSPSLSKKDYMVLINKMDIYSSEHRDVEGLKRALEEMKIDALPVSALTGQGIDKVKAYIAKRFHSKNQRPKDNHPKA